jgi:hypothetical protein
LARVHEDAFGRVTKKSNIHGRKPSGGHHEIGVNDIKEAARDGLERCMRKMEEAKGGVEREGEDVGQQGGTKE